MPAERNNGTGREAQRGAETRGASSAKRRARRALRGNDLVHYERARPQVVAGYNLPSQMEAYLFISREDGTPTVEQELIDTAFTDWRVARRCYIGEKTAWKRFIKEVDLSNGIQVPGVDEASKLLVDIIARYRTMREGPDEGAKSAPAERR